MPRTGDDAIGRNDASAAAADVCASQAALRGCLHALRGGFHAPRSRGHAPRVALAALLPLLGGCFERLHVVQPVEIEVFDATSGEPVAGATVVHGAPTGKFERSLCEHATTDGSGVARTGAIRLVDDGWWQLLRRDATASPGAPIYDATGLAQVPPAFTRVATPTGAERYRAPLWPDLWFVIALPEDYRGLVAWTEVEADVDAGSGWLPAPELLAERCSEGTSFRGLVHPDARGSIAHPTSVGGVPGFAPTNFDGSTDPSLLMGGRFLDVVHPRHVRLHPIDDAAAPGGRRLVRTPLEPTAVRAWRLEPERIPGAPTTLDGRRYVWFIGSLDELRAWLHANALRPLDDWGRPVGGGDPAITRVFAARALLPLVPVARTPSDPPEWSVRQAEPGQR